MTDELTDTEGLRLIAWSLEGGNVRMADECHRAADEIERLRTAGDALVAAIRNHDLTEAHLRAWQEARRG